MQKLLDKQLNILHTAKLRPEEPKKEGRNLDLNIETIDDYVFAYPYTFHALLTGFHNWLEIIENTTILDFKKTPSVYDRVFKLEKFKYLLDILKHNDFFNDNYIGPFEILDIIYRSFPTHLPYETEQITYINTKLAPSSLAKIETMAQKIEEDLMSLHNKTYKKNINGLINHEIFYKIRKIIDDIMILFLRFSGKFLKYEADRDYLDFSEEFEEKIKLKYVYVLDNLKYHLYYASTELDNIIKSRIADETILKFFNFFYFLKKVLDKRKNNEQYSLNSILRTGIVRLS